MEKRSKALKIGLAVLVFLALSFAIYGPAVMAAWPEAKAHSEVVKTHPFKILYVPSADPDDKELVFYAKSVQFRVAEMDSPFRSPIYIMAVEIKEPVFVSKTHKGKIMRFPAPNIEFILFDSTGAPVFKTVGEYEMSGTASFRVLNWPLRRLGNNMELVAETEEVLIFNSLRRYLRVNPRYLIESRSQ